MAFQKDTKVRRLTAAAMAAALVFVVTWLVKIPVPVSGGAYLNFGDSVIYVCAFILGGPMAALSAGIGSALADLAGGAAAYAVPTFFIKAAMGLVAGLMTRSQKFWPYCAACIVGGAIMTAGYAAFEWGFFGASLAFATLPFNLIQWCGSVLVALVLYKAASRLSSMFHIRDERVAVPEPAHH